MQLRWSADGLSPAGQGTHRGDCRGAGAWFGHCIRRDVPPNKTTSGTSSTTTTAADGTPTAQSSQSSSVSGHTILSWDLNGIQLSVRSIIHWSWLDAASSRRRCSSMLSRARSCQTGSRNASLKIGNSYVGCGANPLWSLAGYALSAGTMLRTILIGGRPAELGIVERAIPCAFIP